MIDQTDFDKCLKGFRIIDCVVRNKDIFYFTAQAEYQFKNEMDKGPFWKSELDHRIIVFFAKKEVGQQWNYVTYEGMESLLAGSAKHPTECFIGLDRHGYVAVLGGGVSDLEEPVPYGPKGPKRGGVRKAKTIEGLLHICTGNRGLARRDGSNQWSSLCSDLAVEEDDSDEYFNQGFDDFDAFDSREIYCAGGRGDAWYSYNGLWKRIPLPENNEFLTVCCAGDGWVYIGCEDRTVWRGRRDKWQLFEKPRSFSDQIPTFNDMVWFQDRVYGTSNHALWEIVDNDCGECVIPDEVKECCGNLSVADGVMLMAGEYGAASYDGREWTILYRAKAFR
jgi:hypothetical protein